MPATKASFMQKLEQSIHDVVPPRPGLPRNHEPMGTGAPARASW
jgi:hypothetical protein